MSLISRLQEIIQKEKYVQRNLIQRASRYKEKILEMSKYPYSIDRNDGVILDEENVKWTISSMKNDGDDGELENDTYTLGNVQEIKNFVALIPSDGVNFFIEKVRLKKKIID